MSAPRVVWTPERRARIISLRAAGLRRWEIADVMGLSFNAVRSAFYEQGRKPKNVYEKAPTQRGRGDFVVPLRCPATVLAERDQRISAPHRDNTAALLGDPPVGYSALDGR